MKKILLEYIILKKSGLFNAWYYLREYSDVRKADVDPLMHFIKEGWKEGRNPSPDFNTSDYIQMNPDVKRKNINPLIHFIKHKQGKGRKSSVDLPTETNQKNDLKVKKIEADNRSAIKQSTLWGILTRLVKMGLHGLYFLRVNGFKAFIRKILSLLGNPQTKITRLVNRHRRVSDNNPFEKIYKENLAVSVGGININYVEFSERKVDNSPEVKLIAFYLPQFHPIPENDAWWGKGFTEWVNVSKAIPQFVGHYQPHLPGELGYYDLRIPENQRRQVELAKNYGLFGFCFHYYWFNGKRLLEKPLDQFIHDPNIDFPFCICWANENWTRKWDGKSNDILISQEHSFEYDTLIIHDLVKLFLNPRYIRIEGRPLLIVYRADIIKNAKSTLEYWRKYSIDHGAGDPYILVAQTFGYNDPRTDGFDGAVEFPPHNGAVLPEIDNELILLNDDFRGKIYRYADLVSTSIKRIKPEAFSRYNTVSPGWDNDSRQPRNGLTFHGSTPELYARWLDAACRFAMANKPESERFVFINAWNEWAESAYLEPDRKFGYAYLQATADVVDNLSKPEYIPKPRLELSTPLEKSADYYQQKVESITLMYPWYSTISEAKAGGNYEEEIKRMARAVDVFLALCVMPKSDLPLVSIIIPVHNHFDATLNCLKSLSSTQEKASFEIIIIDDSSTDVTFDVLSKCENIQYIRNEQNLGFLRSCNKAAQTARGQYLVFLNNDTIVLPGWLDSLIDTFGEYHEAGLVGSKLIYPDGRLQEAGGVMWEDATGINFGRDDDPKKPQYNYLRDADYCSGASICIPKPVWEELDGFDELFTPAYYEDTDLAFRLRKRGYSVLFQPFSRVIHLEGVTSGTNINTGIKRYQEVNRQKFIERWKDVLREHGNSFTPPILYRNRIRMNRAFVIDVCTPKPDHDSGSIDTYQYLLNLRKIGFDVTFISVVDANVVDHYVEDLQKRGIECIYTPYLRSIDDFIKQMGKYYDLVMLFRAPYGGRYIDTVRKYAINAKIVFNTVDLHFLRDQRQSELTGKGLKLHETVSKNDEIGIMKKADMTIVVSEYEQQFLSSMVKNINPRVMPLPREIPGRERGFEGRQHIVFIGGYLHRPNVDAVKYFISDIWPLIVENLPDCQFWIVGSNVPSEFYKLAGEKIKVIGYVADLSKVFSECKLSIAPLRYGAGIKGKIITSLSYGVPCVATPIAAEGMSLTHEYNVMLGDTPTHFTESVVKLYTDSDLWDKVSENGLAYVKEKYSIGNFEKNLRQLVSDLGIDPDS